MKPFLILIMLVTFAGTYAEGQTTRTIVYDGKATEVSVSPGAAK